MSRVNSMSRFAEPEEVKPVCTCAWCDAELYEGDTVLEVECDDTVCSTDCLIALMGIVEKTL